MAEVFDLGAGIVSVGISTKGLGKQVAESLDAGAGDVDKTGSKLGDVAGTAFGKKLTTALATGAVVAGVVGAFKGLYEIGSVFDEVSDTIRIGTGATGDNLEGLTAVAMQVGKEIPAAFSSVGQTVADLNTRLGLTGDTLKTVASQYLEAGRILGQDVDIQSTTAAFSAFKIEGDAVVGGMDTLFRISQATGVGMNELAATVQSAAPAMQNLGFSFEETAALAGSLDKAGLSATTVLGGMGRGLINLAKDGEEPQEAFRRITGEISAMIEAGDVAGAIDLAGGVFGRSANDIVGAVQSGTLAFDDLIGAAGLTSDTILGVGAETQDFAEKWQVVQNNAQAALEPLASAVFTALGDTLSAMMPTLTLFGDWLAENPVVLQIAAVAAGVLTAAVIGLTVATWAMNTALLANPITWIVLAVVALIAAIVLLVMNWDTVVAFLTDTWNGFVGWFVGVMEGFAGWWNDVWAGFVGFVTDVWNGFQSWFMSVLLGFVGWWNDLWAGLFGFVNDVWNGFVSWITGAAVGFLNWYIGLWAGLVSGVLDLWNGFVGWIRDGFNNLLAGMRVIGSSLASWWNGLWSGLASFVGDAFRNIGNFIVGVLNTVIGLVNGALSGINDMGAAASQITGGAIGWSIGTLPTIPMLAEGGIVPATVGGRAVIVGEAGRDEAVVDASHLQRALKNIADGNAGGGKTLNYYAAPNDSIDAEAKLDEAMERAEALGW